MNFFKSPRRDVKGISERDNTIYFYWYDKYTKNNDGSVILFGKAYDKIEKRYISCSVLVQNIQREVYFLPREFKVDDDGDITEERVRIEDIHNEIKSLIRSKEIHDYDICTCKRRYAFESTDIPDEAQYVRLQYSYIHYQFPKSLVGKTFSRIFGAETDPFDRLVLPNKIQGPCWLEIKSHDINTRLKIFCDLNLLVSDPIDIAPTSSKQSFILESPPPLNILSISFETYLNRLTQENTIIAASICFHPNIDIDKIDKKSDEKCSRFSYVRPFYISEYPKDIVYAIQNEKSNTGHTIVLENSEKDLIQALIAKIHRLDPDIVVGHNFAGVYLDTLLRRMKKLDVFMWQKIGRIDSMRWPVFQMGAGGDVATYRERLVMSGRVICDTFTASQELIKSKSYHLSDLASSLLDTTRYNINPEDYKPLFTTGSGIIQIVNHCSKDALLSYSIMSKLQILPLTRQLTNIAGNLWSKSINGNRLDRNEYILLHTFYSRGYIVPDRPTSSGKRSYEYADEDNIDLDAFSTKKRKNQKDDGPSFTGGLVLEPKKGLYQNYVLLLDFNSLYPSIIREYNVCFTSMRYNANNVPYDYIPEVPDESVTYGYLPQLVGVFVQKRQKLKALMKNKAVPEPIREKLNIEQLALKLTANSMYGCLGASHSRFYAKPLAAFITMKGREILQSTVELAKSLGLDVIYGDTDSIMIDTKRVNIRDAKALGLKLKQKINERYKVLEIGIDQCFKRTLLLQKKKYAAIAIENFDSVMDGDNINSSDIELKEVLEVKGIDLVRRDWCRYSQKVSQTILEFILSDSDNETIVQSIIDHLRFVSRNILTEDLCVDDFIIRKQLNKPIEEYSDIKGLPHVRVAREMRSLGYSVKVGDTIPYVMIKTGIHNNTPTLPEKVFSCSEQIDLKWYISKQILPPVYRICKPLKSIDLNKLVGCLGLKVDSLIEKEEISDDEADVTEKEEKIFSSDDFLLSDATRYKDLKAIRIYCNTCGTLNKYSGPIRKTDQGEIVCGLTCAQCNYIMNIASVKVQVMIIARSYITEFYNGFVKCDKDSCEFRIRNEHLTNQKCLRGGCGGILVRDFSARQLYDHLSYLKYIFDINEVDVSYYNDSIHEAEKILEKNADIYKCLLDEVNELLELNQYRFIDFVKIFGED